MKLYIKILLVLFTGILFSTCSNELEIAGNFKVQTVITGILEANRDTNYIRIEKTFLPEEESALGVSASSTTVFYDADEIDAFLVRNSTNEKFTLERIDGDSLGLMKEPGIFSYSPNILYRYIGNLVAADSYSIYVINKITHDTVSSSTAIVNNFTSFSPVSGYIDFIDNENISYSCTRTGSIYELWMHFHYTEKDLTTGDSTNKEVSWQIFKNSEPEDPDADFFTYSLTSASFYSFLGNNITVDNNVKRYFSRIDFTWYAGGMEILLAYKNALLDQGILNGYYIQNYTNIDGGLGIFSSMYVKKVNNVQLTEISWDSLACGRFTKKLNFMPNDPPPDFTGCH